MGFFAARDYNAVDMLRNFARHIGLKLAFIVVGWVGLYFFTQLIREGTLALFNPLVGLMAGLVIGWTLAEDAVEESGLTGIVLWVILTLAGCLPIFLVEGLMSLFLHWEIGFGRWMCITSAIVMTMASAVWRASADE